MMNSFIQSLLAACDGVPTCVSGEAKAFISTVIFFADCKTEKKSYIEATQSILDLDWAPIYTAINLR